MARYVTVDPDLTGGVVDSVAEWDGVTPWPDSARAVQSDTAQVGDSYDGQTFSAGVSVQAFDAGAAADADVLERAANEVEQRGLTVLAEWLRRQAP